MKHRLGFIFSIATIFFIILFQIQTIPAIQKAQILLLLSKSKHLQVAHKVGDEWKLPRRISSLEQNSLVSSFQSPLTWTFWWEPFLIDSEVDMKIIADTEENGQVLIYFGFSSNKIIMEGYVPCEMPRKVRWAAAEL